MATRAEVYQPGRVYCYRCDSALCPHSIPPGPSCVFGGYSSTGLPLWPDFPQLLLELKHPEIDLLYQPAPSGLLAACMDADLLRHRQLNVFGRQSKTYNILGQVIFGFVVMRRPLPGVGKERVAFSLQAVESRRLDGRPRLEFNIVGRLPGGEPALNMLEGPYQARIFDILVTAGQRVRCLMPATGSSASALAARDEAEIKSPVMEILRKLAGKLQKVGRQQGRRTAHAEDRRVNHRPTPNAREDALAAPDELVFWDERRRTLAVVGPRNRVHIFSPEGRHVTSIILEAEAVQSRVRRKRWTPPAGEHLQRFRAALANPPSSADAAPPKQPRKSTPTFR